MIDLPEGWQERLRQEVKESLERLPDSAKPQRTRPTYIPPEEARGDS